MNPNLIETIELIERARKDDSSCVAWDSDQRYVNAVMSNVDALLQAAHDAERYEKLLGNLLARVHRDGGHYQEAHGTDKAVADADLIVAELIHQDHELKARAADAERYRKALEEIQDFQSECRCPPEGCGCCEQGMKDIAFAALKGGA